jgi:hypothetical protein
MKDIWEMAKTGDWSGSSVADPKELAVLVSERDENDKTPIHIAAQHGQLNKVPKELLTQENIVKQDKEGKTVLHYAILDIRNGFKNIPKELLKEENLTIEDINSNTIFHMLGYSRDLNLIDQSILKERHLIKPNSLGITPIEYVCHGGDHGKEGSLEFFRRTINRLSIENLNSLKEGGKIRGEFGTILDKELKNRAIAKKLSKVEKTLDLN